MSDTIPMSGRSAMAKPMTVRTKFALGAVAAIAASAVAIIVWQSSQPNFTVQTGQNLATLVGTERAVAFAQANNLAVKIELRGGTRQTINDPKLVRALVPFTGKGDVGLFVHVSPSDQVDMRWWRHRYTPAPPKGR